MIVRKTFCSANAFLLFFWINSVCQASPHQSGSGILLESPSEVLHGDVVMRVSTPHNCVGGVTVPVEVTIVNKGDTKRTFDLSLTDLTDQKLIGIQTVILSAAGQSGLDDIHDLTLAGERKENQGFGDWLAVGDVNGDGCGDLLVSAGGYNNGQGRAYLYCGGETINEEADKIFTGENTGDGLGDGGGCLGDMNKDGFDDVIIGARYYKNRGRVYIYWGGPDMDENADVIIESEKEVMNSSFGRGMAVGDVNGDGYTDLFISAPGSSRPESGDLKGRVYLFYGGDLFDTTIDKVFIGENANDGFGAVRSAGGDIDGDGYDDLLIGTRYYPDYPRNQRGRAYLYHGAPGTAMDTVCDLVFDGENDNDEFATGVDLFDIDNDGHADVLISARKWPSGKMQGRLYLYWGSDRASFDNKADLTFTGEADAQATFGGDHVVAGYLNDDKYGDIVVPAYDYYRLSQHGRTYLFYGNMQSRMDNVLDQAFTGEEPQNLIMNARIADFNGDGCGDIAVGGWGYPNGARQGRVWLYYGRSPSSTNVTFGWDTAHVSQGDHTLQILISGFKGENDTASVNTTVSVEVRDPS